MSEAAETASAPVLELNGARATIRLNRPKHLNRLQSEDLGELLKLFDRIEADPAIRVLVLTGTGRAFSAGYDLNSVAERATSAREEQSAGSAVSDMSFSILIICSRSRAVWLRRRWSRRGRDAVPSEDGNRRGRAPAASTAAW